jgi:hypothetical protein
MAGFCDSSEASSPVKETQVAKKPVEQDSFPWLPAPKVQQPDSSDHSSGDESNSGRRVILSHLPSDCHLAQLLASLYGRPCIEAGLYDASRIADQGARGGFIEFITAASAQEFIGLVDNGLVLYADVTGHAHVPRACAAPRRVPHVTGSKLSMLQNGWTRTLKADNFPREAVWFFLCAYGLSNVVKAKYDSVRSILRVEFNSIFNCGAVVRDVFERGFPYFQPQLNRMTGNPLFSRDYSEFQDDRCQPRLGFDTVGLCWEISNDRTPRHPVLPHVSKDHLADKFNCIPYNTIWPSSYFPILSRQGLEPQWDPELILKHQCSQIEAEVSLSRHFWSWQLSKKNDILTETLDDREWEGAWTLYFRSHAATTIDLQRLSRYAAVARHRREKTAEEGRREWEIPQCHGACVFGCGQLHEAPVPKQVEEYLNFIVRPEEGELATEANSGSV